MIHYEHLDRPFLRVQLQSQLFLYRRKDGRWWVRNRLTVELRRSLVRGPAQGHVESPRNSSLIDHNASHRLGQLSRKTVRGHPFRLESSVPLRDLQSVRLRLLQLRSPLGHHKGIDRKLSGLAVAREFEPFDQERLHHLLLA